MSAEAVKLVEKTGTSITKEKLLEAIKRSPQKQFLYSPSQTNAKVVTVVVTL